MNRFYVMAIGFALASCGESDIDVVGTWKAKSIPFTSITLYEDGEASSMGTGLLKLKWKYGNEDRTLVKLDAMDNSLVLTMNIQRSSEGLIGKLTITGTEEILLVKAD